MMTQQLLTTIMVARKDLRERTARLAARAVRRRLMVGTVLVATLAFLGGTSAAWAGGPGTDARSASPADDFTRLDVRVVAGVPDAVGADAVTGEMVQGGSASTDIPEYYGYDAIGSIRVVFDGVGNIIGSTTYSPFGSETYGSAGMPTRRFTGQERDGETGFDYFGARDYQARTGRFGTPDPMFGTSLSQPQLWNRYTYSLANPISFVDPSGMLAQETGCVDTEAKKLPCFATGTTATIGQEWSRSSDYANVVGRSPELWLNVFASDPFRLRDTSFDGYRIANGADLRQSAFAQTAIPAPANPDGTPTGPNGDVPKPPDGKGPDGRLTPNEWVPGPGSDARDVRYKPRYPIPGQSQPNVSWDPKYGHWDRKDGLGGTTRWLPGGVAVDHYNNPISMSMWDTAKLVAPSPVVRAGTAALIGYIIISEASRLFPPRNFVPIP